MNGDAVLLALPLWLALSLAVGVGARRLGRSSIAWCLFALIRYDPTMGTLQALARALGVPVTELLE